MNEAGNAPIRSPLHQGDYAALDDRLELVQTTLREPWIRGESHESMRKIFIAETNIQVSDRQLRRYLEMLGLKRRGAGDDRARIKTAIDAMCPARGQGYRGVRDELALRFGPEFRVPKKLVADIRRETDPESNRFRWKNRLIRRKYVSDGPGSVLHIDQKYVITPPYSPFTRVFPQPVL